MADLTRMFRPRTIAVIGGGVWGSSIIQQCEKIGFDGALWPVHPTKAQIAGRRAYKDVDALPGAPDAAFIGVNRAATITIVAALAARGAGGAVCFASGFSEAEAEDAQGRSLQSALIAASCDMPIIGPNCYGFINYLDAAALWPDQQGGIRVETGVAILTQSSNIAINLTMQQRGVPIAYMVTLGNQAKLGLAAVGLDLLQDPRVTALGCHIEGFGDIGAFEALAAEAARLDKPLIILKVGKSDEARKNAISHTASLAGSDAGAQALIERLGCIRVDTLGEFLEILKLSHVSGYLDGRRLDGPRIASLSCSGGEASLVADAGSGQGVTFPALGEERFARLRDLLGPRVALANPLDYHTYIWHDPVALEAVFSAMTGPDIDITCIVLDFPRADRCDPADWEVVLSAIERAALKTGYPFAVIASLPETMPEAVAIRLLKAGIAPLCGIDEAMRVISRSAAARPDCGRDAGGAGNGAAGQASIREKHRPHAEIAPVLRSRAPQNVVAVSEYETKTALAAYGVNIPAGGRAMSPGKAARLADVIGFPVVLKGEGFAHKSENAAICLNLGTAQAVHDAAAAMPCESYLVEEMIPDMLVELLAGVVRDPAHGFLLTLAAGGIYTEILQDRQSLLIPSDRKAVETVLRRLKIAPLLEGYRGGPVVNLAAVIDTVMAIQAYVMDHAEEIEEIELNPIFCRAHDAVVVDALMRRG